MSAASRCAACGADLYVDDRFCVACGAAADVPASALGGGATRALAALAEGVAEERTACPGCGSDVYPGAGFCSSCGKSLRGAAPRARGPIEVALRGVDPWARTRERLAEAVKGEFELDDEIGRGGMAAVFAAHEVALDRRVAIKVMAPGLLTGEGMVERFAREAVTVAGLHHPNIVSIYTVRHLDDLHFFVMQLVDGRSLREVLTEHRRLPVELVRAMLYEIGTALAYAHRRGVIHRDVKPANVLLDTDGRAVVMDFGIAKVQAQAGHTQTGMAVGTPAYMSPEQCFGREVTWASDQYSLGVVAWEMLAGRPPFEGKPFELMQAHTTAPPPPLRAERPDCPAALEAAVLRMLAKRPEDRFPSMAAALEGLGAAPVAAESPMQRGLATLATAGGVLPEVPASDPPPSPPPPETTPAPTSRRGRWILLGGGAVAAAALLTAWALSRGGGETEPSAPTVRAAATISLSSPVESLPVGGRTLVQATALDSAGAAIEGPVSWSVSDSTIVSLSEMGDGSAELTGSRPGRTVVMVSSGTASQVLDVIVGEPPAAPRGRVAIAGAKRALDPGERLQLSARVTDPSGADDRSAVTWRSSDPGTATVSASGLVTAVGAGRVRIIATAGERSDGFDLVIRGPELTRITVTAPGTPAVVGQPITVRAALDWTGRPGPAPTLRWSSSDPAIASVAARDTISATVTPHGAGTATITATAGSLTGSAIVSVGGPAPVALRLAQTNVTFRAEAGGDPPAEQTVSVDVSGGDGVQATLAAPEYSSGGAGWLQAELRGSVLTLRARPAGLAAGRHQARVGVTAGSASRSLAVELLVTAPADPVEAALPAIESLLERYQTALNTGDASAITRIFPSIPRNDLDDLMSRRISDRVEILLRRGTLRAGSQEGTLEGEVTSGMIGDRAGRLARFVYVFARSGSSWIIESTRPLR
ncbi:MAG: protein kinase [Gemmatimonadales bacterium]